MNSEPSVPKCPQCGAAIPADAPQGLCPRCVLLGAATSTDAGKPVARTEPPAPEALRAAFPQLEILELIGRGGMGFVYKAKQAKLDRLVALKLLPLELGADPHFAERFNREARALARLNHPGIVAVYDFGVSGGFCYLLMEFVDGVNLRQAMQAGRFTQREALALVPKICEAIQFAHEQGVLHRDIKPENILLDTQGRVKIADFGIAKLVGEDTPDLTLTLSGARLGTPSYMAPEQVEHPGTVDHRADIYSLGVVFYELLTGELPLGRFAPPSAKADLDSRVDDIVMRALAKERELRQQSAGEVKTEVETVAASPRERVSAPSPAAATALRPWSVKSWIGSWLLVVAAVVGAFLVFVAGQTVNDLGMGRSRIQPVELVVFLVVTGAALLCWRLGRRLHGHSVPAVAAESLPDRPFLFAEVAPAWKPWLLLGLGLSGALLCFQAVTMLVRMAGATAAVVRSGPLPFTLLVLAGSALIAGAWHGSLRRRELLRSLGLHVPETGPALDRWLSRAVVLLLAGLGGGMLIGLGSLFMVVAAQLNSNPGSNGLLLAAVIVIIGLAASWHRRDSSPPAPAPAPAWMRRVAGWFLAAGTIALLPTLVHWNSASSVWHTASLLVFTGLALWSANPGLRRLALVVNWFGLFSGLGGSLALLWLGSRHELPQDISIGVPGVTTRPGMALLIGLLETGAFAAGLIALHRMDARAAFGVVACTGWRRWLGRLAVATFLVVMVGLQLIVAKQAARSVGPQNDAVARLREIPAGGDRAWLALNPPADLPLRFTVTVWSNGVARPVATNEQVFATYSRPVQVQLTRAIRPGEDGAHWEISDYSELDAEGEETWLVSGIPLSVALQAVNTGATVQLSAGDRLRRWLFLPPFEASQFSATASLPQQPAWGVSVDLEIVQDTAATAKADVLIGLARERLSDVRGRFEVGAVSPLEVAAAERDLAVAEARNDAVTIADANRKYAALALSAARKQFEVGKLTTLELHGYEATNRIAEIELEAALQVAGTTNPISPNYVARFMSVRLDLARQILAELHKQAELGVVAPVGKEMLGAELAVAVAEADLKGDALAAAKARLNHAEKILAIVERMFGVGKATAAEVSEAKLALAEATAGVAKLERGP